MTPERFARLEAVLKQRQPDLTVLADGVHKSHNVSAVMRTCDAVGIHRLHAVSASGEMPRHHMIAGGSKRFVHVKVHSTIDAAFEALASDGFRILAAHGSAEALDYRAVDYTERVAIVLGAELEGPSRYTLDHADGEISIPMHGLVESLNVSVAAAVILFEAERQRRGAGLYSTCRIEEQEYARTIFEWAYPEIARRCREHRIAYPPLGEDGRLLENPFAGNGGAQPGL